MSRYRIAAVSLDMEIDLPDGTVELPVVRFSSVTALNSIPQAAATLAVGVRISDGAVSPVQTELLDEIRRRQKVRVYCELTPGAERDAPPGVLYPEGRFLLFEGSVMHAGFRSDSAEFALALEHWLGDLDAASAVSPSSHPDNPSAFIFRAVHPGDDPKEGAQKTGYTLSSTVASEFIDVGVVQTDLWGAETGTEEGKGILGWLKHLASADAIDTIAGEAPSELTDETGPNQAALDALNRFEPAVDGGVYRGGVPLAMDPTDTPDLDDVSNNIAQTLGNDGPVQMANSTAWDRLLEYAQTYLFAVVPLIDRALVVPFTPGLSATWTTVRADQVEGYGWGMEAGRPVRGVGVYGGRGFESGGHAQDTPPVSYADSGLGGSYIDPTKPVGLYKIVQAPPWAADLDFSRYANAMSGQGGAAAMPTAVAPDVDVEEVEAPAERFENLVPFLDRYAQAVYLREALRGRTLDVSGPFRVDIAPGSTVVVEGPVDRLVGDSDALGKPLTGCVVQVSLSFDAEAPDASTTFRLADLRTQAENADGLQADRHPLWADAWPGAPLHSDLLPAAETVLPDEAAAEEADDGAQDEADDEAEDPG